jgi:hypothetical protein
MRNFTFTLILFQILVSTVNINAQYCGAATSNVAIAPTTTATNSASYSTGIRAFNFAATAGCTYEFSTCGLSTNDTYLRLYSTGTGGTLLAQNDDFCGTQSTLQWTCTTSGTYSILLTRWSCNALNATTRMSYRLVGCGPSSPTSVTSSVASICAGSNASVTLTANGASGTVYWFRNFCASSGQIATGNSITVNPTTTTTYYARNFNNGLWSTNCASVTIAVNPTPTAVSATVNQGTICSGQSVQLNGAASMPNIIHQANSEADFLNFVRNDNKWVYNTTANAGGTSPELFFNWTPSSTGQFWCQFGNAISAQGYTNLNFQFKHFVDHYATPYTIRLQTSTDGVSWTDRWTVSPTADILPRTENINLSVHNNAVFFYRFMFDGNSFNIDGWNIDDIIITGTAPAINYAWSSTPNGFSSATQNTTASPSQNTSYNFTATSNGCNATAQASVTVNSSSTAPSLSAPTMVCPNTTVNISANGGTNGTGAQIAWYTGPNGTGTLLGYGNNYTMVPTSSTVVYARREGACNVTADAQASINLRDYAYAPNNTNSTNYCTDNSGWHHFYNGNNIILSVRGNLSNAGTVTASIKDNGSVYSDQGNPNICSGEAQFEMQRNWNVSYTGTLSGTYEVRYYFDQAERTAVINAANAFMNANPACAYTYKYNAGNNGWFWFKNNNIAYNAPSFDDNSNFAMLNNTANGVTSNGTNYTEISGITGFSGGTGAIVLVPSAFLPVEWMFFTGENMNDHNQLQWATASEKDAAQFEVERSYDAVSFEKIGTVRAAGTSSETNFYGFNDYNMQNGANYYRLKLVNIDGTSEYSEIVVVENKVETDNFSFYPNPTSNEFFYSFATDRNEDIRIEILDMLGRVVKIQNFNVSVGKNNQMINISDLTAGTYNVRVIHSNAAKSHSTKIVKN